MRPALIALDWGTTSLRAYLLGADGGVLDQASAPKGVMQVEAGGFAAAYDGVTASWRQSWPGLRGIASGMVGSASGWAQAPYLPCPAGAAEIASCLVAAPSGLMIVPGVAQYGDAPDVMRGEEAQIIGLLARDTALGGKARLVMPGTHSKWVEVEEGRIRRFTTYMTGELFAVLRQHSTLGRVAEGAPAPDENAARAAFARGVEAARREGSLARMLFSTRAGVLTGQSPAAVSMDYLSGLLIGDELVSGLAGDPGRLVLVGEAALCARYLQAFALLGVDDVPMVSAAEATTAGLWRIATLARLMEPS